MCELVYRMIKVECGVFVEMKIIQKAYDLAWFIIQLVYFMKKQILIYILKALLMFLSAGAGSYAGTM